MLSSAATDIVLLLSVGIAAQLAANLLNIPSILLLLLGGLLVGPIFGVVDPDQVFGPLIFPLTSLGVALILFEGGLGLKFKDLPKVGRMVRNLTLLGSLITAALVTVLAFWLLEFPLPLAALLGALLIVTGPTVVQPLLRSIKVAPDVAAALRWESLLTDPLGAVLALLIFESLGQPGLAALPMLGAWGFFKFVLIGLLLGLIFGALVVVVVRIPWIPGYLETPITLSLVLLASVISNNLQPEAGLLTVTMMGMLLANQRFVTIQHIVLFKENLGVLLLSMLFVTLAARMDLQRVTAIAPQGLWFLVLLILVVRPTAILLSSIGTAVPKRNLIFMAGMAPRGIVAAAVSALLGHQLEQMNYPHAEEFAPLVFFIIIGTVLWYATSARFLARVTGVADQGNSGLVIVGAHRWARRIAAALKELGVKVFLIDTNERNVKLASREGLPAFHGSVLSEDCRLILSEGNYHSLLALTSNDEVNDLSALQFTEVERHADVYKVAPPEKYDEHRSPISAYVRVKPFLSSELPYDAISDLFSRGARIEVRQLESATSTIPKTSEIALIGVTTKRELVFFSLEEPTSDKKLSALVVLVPPQDYTRPSKK